MKREEIIQDLKTLKEFFEENSGAYPVSLACAITELSSIGKLSEPERKDEWIPCTERLPEKSGLYFVTEKNLGNLEVCTRYFNVRGDESFWSGWKYTQVLAWMPLPEPFCISEVKGGQDG